MALARRVLPEDPGIGFGPKVAAIVAELRADPEHNAGALRFIDTYLAARERCGVGTCSPRGSHLSSVCTAGGKSRPPLPGASARPRAAV